MQDLLSPILILFVMGLSVESLVETFKQIRKGRSIDINVVVSIAIGLLLAFTFDLDIYKAMGINAVIPYVTTVVTGIMISRGGGFIYDLWDKFTGGMDNEDTFTIRR